MTGTRPQSDCKCSYLLAKTSLLWPPKVTSPDFSLWFISNSFVSVCKLTTMSSSLSPLLAECHFWAIKFPELLLNIACDTCLAPAPAACKRDGKRVSKSSPTCNIRKSASCWNAMQSTKMLWIWGVPRPGNSAPGGATSSELGRGFRCLGFWKMQEISALV